MKRQKSIVMLGTHFDTMGGISAVVNEYRQSGLLERRGIRYLATHVDGSRTRKLQIFLQAWVRYLALLMTGRVALVHVHMASAASFWRKSLFLLPTYLFGVRAIVHLHGGGFARFYEHDCNRLCRAIVRYVFEHADRVIVLSPTWRRWLARVAPTARAQDIGNPVRVEAPAHDWLRDPGCILFLGRLGKPKGTWDLLAAAALLAPDYPQLKLVLGGDGDLDGARAEARRLGIAGHVEIPGWVDGPAKAALLRRAAVYVLPSYAEGLPMSLLEAMAAGVPVVGSTVGGIPEVLGDGRYGALVAPGDVTGLRDALAPLLADPELRSRMGIAARLRAESTFSVARIVPQIEQLYRELGACP